MEKHSFPPSRTDESPVRRPPPLLTRRGALAAPALALAAGWLGVSAAHAAEAKVYECMADLMEAG